MKTDHDTAIKVPRTRRSQSERKRANGNWNPDWEAFAKLDPAWTEKVISMAIAPAVAGALDRKTIELIGIALDASCAPLYAPGVRRHIRRALDEGATRSEIASVLQLASMAGLKTICVGAPILFDELAAFEQRKDLATQTAKELP